MLACAGIRVCRTHQVRNRSSSVDLGRNTANFDPEFRADRDKIDTPRTRKAIAKTLEQYLGRPVRVVFGVLEDEAAEQPLPSDHPGTSGDPDPDQPKTQAEWIEDPVVRKTLELFRGDIVDIRD